MFLVRKGLIPVFPHISPSPIKICYFSKEKSVKKLLTICAVVVMAMAGTTMGALVINAPMTFTNIDVGDSLYLGIDTDAVLDVHEGEMFLVADNDYSLVFTTVSGVFN